MTMLRYVPCGRTTLHVLVLLALAPAAARAQDPLRLARSPQSAQWADAVERARASANEFMRAHRLPGLSVAVGVNGGIAYAEGFGFADLENRVPVTPLTRMRIGSVSKSVTSVALGQLVEAGKLDLDAEVQKYVPAFPRKRWPITVRQVAGHTAGIRHYISNEENLSTIRYPTVHAGLAIFHGDSLLFEPGTKYSYSSYGWNLISAVVEGASGENFLSYMRRRVFEPLGLRSIVAEHTDSLIAHRARFYEQAADSALGNAPYVDNSYKWAGGGFISNTEDLVQLGMALLQGNVLKAATFATLSTSQKLRDGSLTGYGLGWATDRDNNGRRMVYHTGGSVGGRAVLLLYPDQGVVVAMLSNAGHAPTTPANAGRIVEPFLPR
jgi:CubicO group peptidase (beta-lactamase class C family)